MDTTTYAVIDDDSRITEVHEGLDEQAQDRLIDQHGAHAVWLPMGGEVGQEVDVDDRGEATVRRYVLDLGAHGRTEYDSHEEAVEAAREAGATEIGHDGDLTDGGDRTLVWASEQDADNDDGQHAMGEIVVR